MKKYFPIAVGRCYLNPKTNTVISINLETVSGFYHLSYEFFHDYSGEHPCFRSLNTLAKYLKSCGFIPLNKRESDKYRMMNQLAK